MTASLVLRLGHAVTKRELRVAVERARKAWPAWAPAYRAEDEAIALQRWEDDGGRQSSGRLQSACDPASDRLRQYIGRVSLHRLLTRWLDVRLMGRVLH